MRFNFLYLLVFILIFATLPSPNAYAIKQYRCNGRVQYKPCEADADKPIDRSYQSSNTSPVIDPRFKIRGKRFAKVINTSFSKIGKNQGLWIGTLQGNGLIETELRILHAGVVESQRYMGHIWLQNKSTPFKFKAPLPSGKNWKWDIVAWAR